MHLLDGILRMSEEATSHRMNEHYHEGPFESGDPTQGISL